MRASNLVLLLAASVAAPSAAQPVPSMSLASFQSIELRGGGRVIVRHGPEQRVTVLAGDVADRPIRVEGGQLVIDECRRPCRGGHQRIEVEIVTPRIDRLAVANGGSLRLDGGFPAQPALAASVSSGGQVDARAHEAARVDADIAHGGQILVHAGQDLEAAISDGGGVYYWGNPRVRSSVRRGGGVAPGDPAELRVPLAELGPPLAPPPVPPVPPILPAVPQH